MQTEGKKKSHYTSLDFLRERQISFRQKENIEVIVGKNTKLMQRQKSASTDYAIAYKLFPIYQKSKEA